MPMNQENKPNGSAPKTGNGSVNQAPSGSSNSGAGFDTKGVLGGIADVIRSAGNELRSENEALASYVDMAGDQMRRLADNIRQRGVADMMDDVAVFARRRPALFIGGAFLVGLGIARFLKSSADRGDNRSYRDFSSVDPMTAGTGNPSYSGDLGETGRY